MKIQCLQISGGVDGHAVALTVVGLITDGRPKAYHQQVLSPAR